VTEDREGFLHPYTIEGGVAKTTIRILLCRRLESWWIFCTPPRKTVLRAETHPRNR
jgi:hypothetical protein